MQLTRSCEDRRERSTKLAGFDTNRSLGVSRFCFSQESNEWFFFFLTFVLFGNRLMTSGFYLLDGFRHEDLGWPKETEKDEKSFTVWLL
jgi:hypothetical protein